MLVGARWHIFTYSFGGILIIHWWLSQLAVVFRVDRMGRMGIADFQTKPPTPRVHKNHRLYSTQCLSAVFEAPRGSFATLKPDDLQKLKQMPGSTAPVMSDGFSFSSHLHLGSWAHRTSWHQRRWNERSPCRQGTGTYHENVVMFVVIDGFCWPLTVCFYHFLSLFWLLIYVVPLQRGNVPVPILRGFTDDWATLWRWYLKLKAMATAAHQLSPMSHCWFDSSSCDMTCKFRFFFVVTHYKPI